MLKNLETFINFHKLPDQQINNSRDYKYFYEINNVINVEGNIIKFGNINHIRKDTDSQEDLKSLCYSIDP